MPSKIKSDINSKYFLGVTPLGSNRVNTIIDSIFTKIDNDVILTSISSKSPVLIPSSMIDLINNWNCEFN